MTKYTDGYEDFERLYDETRALFEDTQPAIMLESATGYDDVYPTSEPVEGLISLVQSYLDCGEVRLTFVRY